MLRYPPRPTAVFSTLICRKRATGQPWLTALRLRWLALGVTEGATELVCCLPAQCVACTPEIRCARLIGDIAQHASDPAFLDFPKGLPAKLEVVALLIDRIAAVDRKSECRSSTSAVRSSKETLSFDGSRETLGMRGKGDVAPALGVQAAVGFLTPDERC